MSRQSVNTTTCDDDSSSWKADGLISGVALMLLLTVVQRGTGFFRNVMVCRWLEPDQLGYWNLANSFLMLAAPLVVLGIPGSFARYLEHYRQRGRLHAFLRRSLIATGLLAVAGVVVLAMNREFAAWLTFGDSGATTLLVTCAITLLFVIGSNACVELLTALRQVKVVSYLQFGNSLIFTTVALAFVGLTQLNAIGVVIGYAVACLATSIVAMVVIWRCVGTSPGDVERESPASFWSKMLPFAIWFWLSDLTMNLFFAIDRYMIIHFSGVESQTSLAMIGQYHSSQIIGVLLMALTGMLGTVLLSYLSHDWESGRRDEARRNLDFALKSISLSLTAVSAGVLLLAPAIFGWALANKYDDGLRVLPMTMTYCIWFGMIPVAKNYLWCREKAWLASAAVMVGLVTNVILNYLWLPRLGLTGAVWATTTANLITLSVVYALTYRLGMRFSRGTLVATLLPAVLCIGPLPAIAAVVAVLGTGWTAGWLFEPHERESLNRFATQGLERLEQTVGVRLPVGRRDGAA